MSANAVSANAVSAKALRVTAGTTAAEAVAAAGLPAAGPKAIVVVRDPSGTLRDLDWAPDVDTDVTPVALDEPRRPQRAAALDGARARAGRTGPVPRGEARHRTADRGWLLLRLRGGHAVPPGRPRPAREAHAGDHQGGPALPPAALRLHRGGQGRTRRRAVQARAGRPQVRRRHRRGHGGRRRRADHLRQPRPAVGEGLLVRPVPRPASAQYPVDRRVQAHAHAPPPTGAARRRTRSCSASTAPRGRPATRSRPI